MASTNSWRLRPRDGRKFPIRITEEVHTVEFNSDWNSWGIQLNEAPILSDSSISAPIMLIVENDSAETEFTEVPRTSGPSVGQYVVDYEQDGYFGTGRIEFNSADGGTSVKVTYWGMGILFTQSNVAAALDGQNINPNDIIVGGNIINGLFRSAIFTSSGTWTVPEDVTKCYAKVIGAGGGAARSTATLNTVLIIGAGGGGGGVSEKLITGLTPGSGITITVGTGGDGGTSVTQLYGLDGGSSSFGAHCSATGGHGGGSATDQILGGVGGIGSSGDLNYSLGDGQSGLTFNTNSGSINMTHWGASGGGPGGGGSSGDSRGSTGKSGKLFGGGGGSGAVGTVDNADADGGNGADGVVVIWY
jgi:hypothetical protein